MEQATMAQIRVELATVERLDRINAAVVAAGDEGAEWALDTPGNVIECTMDRAINEGTAEAWARAYGVEHHRAATLGDLAVVEVDATTAQALDGALAEMRGMVDYRPTYGTAISLFLNVAKWSGGAAPGEE